MVREYVIKLIENLPDNIKNTKCPQKVDLVLDGGIFNGSYLIGALFFLKEMEKQKFIKITRISGCSIGSIAGFLYYIDALDVMPKLYNIVNNEFKETHHLNTIKKLKTLLVDHIPENICKLIHKKFYISYYNIKKGVKKTKCTYSNTDDLINTIIKSCYIPYLIDGDMLYKDKYFDGVNPYIFKPKMETKILYLDLFGYDKIGNLLNVKNEKTNYHRILSGMLDIHNFFIKQTSTSMCSYVNDWNYLNNTRNCFKQVIEQIVIWFIYVLVYIKKKVSVELQNSVISKICIKIMREIFVIVIDTYCI